MDVKLYRSGGNVTDLPEPNEQIQTIEELFYEKNMKIKEKLLQKFYDSRIKKTKKCIEITKKLKEKSDKELRKEYVILVQELNKEYVNIHSFPLDVTDNEKVVGVVKPAKIIRILFGEN